MDVRKKMVELLKTNSCPSPFMCDTACRYYGFGDCFPERFADHLIANGVTVQEWISVDDRLPSDGQDVLVIAHGWDGRLVYVGSHKRVEAQKSWITGITNKSSEWLLWGWSYLKEPMVTHWMPIPQPPKGE